MPKAAGKAAASKKAAAKPKTTTRRTKSTKLSISLEPEMILDLECFLAQIGYSKEEFAVRAIKEKLDRDKISFMIDTIIR